MKVNKNRQDSKITIVGPSIGSSLILCIPFVILKLFEIITWSWVWILTPLWIWWVLVFVAWLWISSLNVITKTIATTILKCSPIMATSVEEKTKEEEDRDGM